jgi:hypothetical protein
MTMLKILPGALLMSAACSTVPAEPAPEDVPVHGGTAGACNAGRGQSLVGRQPTTELGAEALRLTGARALRWIRPGDAVTMDYREDRLNIELDANGRVRALRCG